MGAMLSPEGLKSFVLPHRDSFPNTSTRGSPTARTILRTFKTTFVPRHHLTLHHHYLIWKLIALDGKIKTTYGHFVKLKQFTV